MRLPCKQGEVLGSVALGQSPRSRDFLSYVVTETVAGRADRLSERTVGRRAMGRASTFDGRLDASVRVRASRVRKSLAEYYASEGLQDHLRIELPTGSYVPRFVRSAMVVHPEPGRDTEYDLTIVVLHFSASGNRRADLVAATLGEALVQRLSGIPEMRVIGPATSRSLDPKRIGRDLGGRFVLKGHVACRGGMVRLSARLSDAANGEVIWAATEVVDAETLGFEVEEQWATGVAAELGDYTGVVHRRAAQRPSSAVDPREYAARMAFQAYADAGSPATLVAADQALAGAMEAGLRSPVLLAMRGSTRAVRAGYGLAEDREAELAAAEHLAREALAADPGSGHAHVVLGTVAACRRHWSLARTHAEDAARASPSQPTVLATAGYLIAYSGDWEAGVTLLRESLRLNPLHPGHMHSLLALERLMADDDAAALAEASLIHAPGAIWGPLFRAMALVGLGHVEQAQEEMDEALAVDPNFLADPVATFTSNANLTQEQIAVVLRHLEPFGYRLPAAGDV